MKFKFFIKPLTITLLLSLFISIPASAAPEGFFNNYNKLKPGVRNKFFSINSGTSTYWQNILNDSFYLWYLTNTPINFDKTTIYSQSIIDCGTEWNSDPYSPWGYATFWLIKDGPDTPISGDLASWDYGTVTLNNALMQNTTYDFDTRVTMHETGHVFGLAHVSNAYDLMYGSSQGHLTNRPSQNDVNKINTLHK